MNREPEVFNPWPAGIVAAFAVFITATVTLIVVATRNRMELVTPDYYEQEIRYQQQMDRLERTRALGSTVRLVHDPARNRLSIQLPSEHVGRSTAGRIHFYRPSAAGQDRQIEFQPDSTGEQSVDAGQFSPGLWKVRILWTVGNEEYFSDDTVVLPPRA
jgi:nitrogen fixation protein FixH